MCHLLGKPETSHTIIVKLRNPGTSTFGAVWYFYSHHNSTNYTYFSIQPKSVKLCNRPAFEQKGRENNL